MSKVGGVAPPTRAKRFGDPATKLRVLFIRLQAPLPWGAKMHP